MLKHISSPLDPLSLMSERKARRPVNTLHVQSTMVAGKLLQWFIVCPENMLYTVRLNWKCFTFQLLILFYLWLLDVHQKLRTIINGARMAVIMFNSSRMHCQISTCVTKAASCFPHLGRETEVRERKITIPGPTQNQWWCKLGYLDGLVKRLSHQAGTF